MKNKVFVLIFFGVFFLLGCEDRDEGLNPVSTEELEHTVAVVLPLGNGLEKHWDRTLKFIGRNMDIAFEKQSSKVKIKYELFDENAKNLEDLAEELGEREDVEAVIGCLYSDNAKTFVDKLAEKEKPFLTMASSTELIRANTGHGYMWALVESDITQSEVLLSKALSYKAKRVALLAKANNRYCQSFIDWMPFQARELGIEVAGVFLYDDGNMKQVCEDVCRSGADYVVCAPYTVEDVKNMCVCFDELEKSMECPKRLYSDTGFGSDVLDVCGRYAEGLECVAFSSDPETGFETSYYTFFGEGLTLGESQLYDSCMLLYYSFWYQYLYEKQGLSLNECLKIVVEGRDENHYGWMGEDMQKIVNAFAGGAHPNVRGASGSLDFDSDVCTNVVESTYANYVVYRGKYEILGYNKSKGGRRTESTLAGWNWKKNMEQDFDEGLSVEYSELKDKWALLVAGSEGWTNYRHQADVLSVYQTLKQNGYSDDRIILVMADDLANNEKNPHVGVVKVEPNGENLYEQIELDYNLKKLKPTDILNILIGKKTEKTPNVLETTENDNILVFWSGHGTSTELCWGNEFMGVRKDKFHEAVSYMAENNRYRKLFFLIEACYSGSMVRDIEEPGVLFMTAAGENETSKAELYSNKLGTWMTNGFTSGLRDQMKVDVNVTVRDLYYKLFVNTVGSHVMVYNAENFGNVYTDYMDEFLLY